IDGDTVRTIIRLEARGRCSREVLRARRAERVVGRPRRGASAPRRIPFDRCLVRVDPQAPGLTGGVPGAAVRVVAVDQISRPAPRRTCGSHAVAIAVGQTASTEIDPYLTRAQTPTRILPVDSDGEVV